MPHDCSLGVEPPGDRTAAGGVMDARWHVVVASEQDRPDIARLRYWWRRYLGRLDPARLVFVDATWAKTNITRTHGWYRRGLPLRGTIPHAHWRTMTFLAPRVRMESRCPASSTGRSLASASQPGSSSSWTRRSTRVTSSLWTTSVA